MVAEAGFEPHDLRVMSPTSYQAAPLRDMMVPEAGVEPVREKISRDFKSRASANSAIPAYATNLVFRIAAYILYHPLFDLSSVFLLFLKKPFKSVLTSEKKCDIIYKRLMFCFIICRTE